MQIDLLGPFEVHLRRPGDETPVQITAAKLRQALALLAVNAESVVSTRQLIDELWPSGPPNTVRTIIQTYVYQLRKLFFRGSESSPEANLLITRPGGYVLEVPRENVDIFRFQSLMQRGGKELRQGHAAHAAQLLRDALGLWRGPVPHDIASGPSLHGLALCLEEQRLEALSLRIEADLANDRHREIVGELRSLVSTHQLHEPLYIRLMEALHRSGRRGEALTVYRDLHQVLDDELGLEPSLEARKLQHSILASR